MERIRAAVLLPVRIDVKDVYDETCTELRVTAALDSGGRGRPRVTYDVTAALANMGAPRKLCSHAPPWGVQGPPEAHARPSAVPSSSLLHLKMGTNAVCAECPDL